MLYMFSWIRDKYMPRNDFTFGTDEGKIIIGPSKLEIVGDMKSAALAMAKDVFKHDVFTTPSGEAIHGKAWIRRNYYDITILNHNGKFSAHLDATKPVEEYPSWWFEFAGHFDTICGKLGAFM
jgi:hypothetical protein